MRFTAPTVFVVDSDPAARAQLEDLVRRGGWTPRCFENAAALLADASPASPSCVLLDSGEPEREGLAVQQRIASDRGASPVIVLTERHDVPLTVRAMRAGAMEVLTKPCVSDTLAQAISVALDYSQVLLASQEELRSLRRRHASLTQREREVMTRVVAGRLNKQIASELSISEITVKAHRGRVMRKMNAASLAELVGMALRLERFRMRGADTFVQLSETRVQ